MKRFVNGSSVRFFSALALSIFFYTKMDILIWQRIFESNELWDLGIGSYHWGWTHALFGFMALGAVLLYPRLRQMLTFPLSLAVLVFSGLEDVLYYWLDGRSIPAQLPWLNINPLVFKPVTATNLLLSALFWLFAVFSMELIGMAVENRIHRQQFFDHLNPVSKGRSYFDVESNQLEEGL